MHADNADLIRLTQFFWLLFFIFMYFCSWIANYHKKILAWYRFGMDLVQKKPEGSPIKIIFIKQKINKIKLLFDNIKNCFIFVLNIAEIVSGISAKSIF